MRIVFALMGHYNPISGGLQVMREHMQYLHDAGFHVAAYFYHHEIWEVLEPLTPSIFPRLKIEDLNSNDLVVVAEEFVWLCASDLLPRNIKYVIANQGLFATFTSPELNYTGYKQIYENAECILANSDHTEKGVMDFFDLPRNKVYKFRIGVDSNKYYPAKKENLISFYTYKNKPFGEYMNIYIAGRYPNFKIEKMERVSREESIEIFQKTKLFLSYGGPEGFGLPPLEAAFCGCKVIGFDGYAGAEFWKEPIFTTVDFIDHAGFISKLKSVIEEIDHWDAGALEYIDYLRDFYSVERAKRSVISFYKNFI